MKYKVVRICNSEANTCIPLEEIRFDLEATAAKLRELGFSTEIKGMMILAKKEGVEYSIYRTGKMLIHPMDQDKAKAVVDELYPVCVMEQRDD